jgi:hypothetical protein
MSKDALTKYRPVLTAQQISHLVTLCKRDGSRDSLSCLGQLVLYEFKIQNELLQPALISAPKEKLINSLGFDDGEESNPRKGTEGIHIPAETLYNLWLVSPQELTVHQLGEVQKYRYENNKMTVDEEKKYEAEVLGV